MANVSLLALDPSNVRRTIAVGDTVPAYTLSVLGGTTVGQELFKLTNPSAVSFIRINADNTVTARSASQLRTDLGLGTAALNDIGTNGLFGAFVPVLNANNSWTGIQTFGTITATQQINTISVVFTGVNYPGGTGANGTFWFDNIANTFMGTVGGTDHTIWHSGNILNIGTTQASARTALGATTIGANIFTQTNPGAITFPRYNADNSVSALSATAFITALGGTTIGRSLLGLTNPSAVTFIRMNADNSVTARTAAEMLTDLGVAASGIGQTFGAVLTDLNVAMSTPPMLFSYASTATNTPSANAGMGVHISITSTSAAQIVVPQTTNRSMFYRIATGSTWGTWYEVKQRAPRISSAATGNITPNTANFDITVRTAQAAAITISNPSDTPADGQKVGFRLRDNGTARAITWGTAYRGMTSGLPATTTANKTLRVEFEYNATEATYDLLIRQQQA